jgi:hypothetical protein
MERRIFKWNLGFICRDPLFLWTFEFGTGIMVIIISQAILIRYKREILLGGEHAGKR